MKITLFYFGKSGDKSIQELETHYIKRIQPFISFEAIALKEVKASKSLSNEGLKEKEAQDVLSRIKSDDYVIALDERGKMLSSPQWAQKIESIQPLGKNLVCIIGGAIGLHESVRQRADFLLSLSTMVTTHDLARVFFLEQLYRAYMIINNRSYHKA